jgi:hypothetical protein
VPQQGRSGEQGDRGTEHQAADDRAGQAGRPARAGLAEGDDAEQVADQRLRDRERGHGHGQRTGGEPALLQYHAGE